LQGPAHQEPDRQRQRRHRLEIEERLHPDASHLLEVLHRGDAVHHGAEDHRGDHHLDELDEAVAERLQRLAGVGKKMPDQDADGDRDQDLDVENRIPGMPYGMSGTILDNF
jgi:hypothetical protein